MMFSTPRTRSNLRVFGGSSHPELTRTVAKKVGVRVGNIKLSRFANHELNVQLMENCRGHDIYIIQVCYYHYISSSLVSVSLIHRQEGDLSPTMT